MITHLVYFITLNQGDQRNPLTGDWDQALFEPLLKIPIDMEEEEFYEKAMELSLTILSEEDVRVWEESQVLLLQLLISGNIIAFEQSISVDSLVKPFRETQGLLPKNETKQL